MYPITNESSVIRKFRNLHISNFRLLCVAIKSRCNKPTKQRKPKVNIVSQKTVEVCIIIVKKLHTPENDSV